jgi:hypothetical protein
VQEATDLAAQLASTGFRVSMRLWKGRRLTVYMVVVREYSGDDGDGGNDGGGSGGGGNGEAASAENTGIRAGGKGAGE